MTAEIPPIVPERREVERRKDWHTPEGCHKLLDVQTAMDRIFNRLKEGDERMDSIFGHLIESKGRMDCIENKLNANTKSLNDNTEKTNRIFEIVEMGEGLFKGIKFTGKWLRRSIMWVVPPVAAIIGLWQMIFNKQP